MGLLAILIAGRLFTGAAQAGEKTITVSKAISTVGLDLRNPADAQTLYTQLRHGAEFVCRRGLPMGLLQVDDFVACFEKSLGNAVRQAYAPLIIQAYLGNHTLRDAAKWGIEFPATVAAN